jgi:hypothetical protein
MERATKIALMTLRASAGLLILLGLGIWTGKVDGLIPVHAVLGFALVGSLWTICYTASRAGISNRMVVPAAAWGLIAIVFGMAQENILTGNLHWIIQVLHVVVSMAAVGLGDRLVRMMRKRVVAS